MRPIVSPWPWIPALAEAGKPVSAVELGRGQPLPGHAGAGALVLLTGASCAAVFVSRPSLARPFPATLPAERTRLLKGTTQGSRPSTNATEAASPAGNLGLEAEPITCAPPAVRNLQQGVLETPFGPGQRSPSHFAPAGWPKGGPRIAPGSEGIYRERRQPGRSAQNGRRTAIPRGIDGTKPTRAWTPR